MNHQLNVYDTGSRLRVTVSMTMIEKLVEKLEKNQISFSLIFFKDTQISKQNTPCNKSLMQN